METIINYLDNMFMNMPANEKVEQAKQDILNMMEDKYNELKAQGKSENEAIGIVISEFGNIDEVAKELGINIEENTQNDNVVKIGINKAKEVIAVYEARSKKIAIGVLLCIISPITLILLNGMYENGMNISELTAGCVGFVVLAVLVALAVGIFIINGMQLSKYEYLKKQVLQLDAETNQYVRDLQEQNRGIFAAKITVGVIMCIISVIPVVVIGSVYENNEFLVGVSVSILLAVVSIAVYLFVTAGMKWSCFDILLQEHDYTKEKKEDNDLVGIISGIYWPIVVCIYLIWSFITNHWEITWIVWPIAGILFGAIASICSAVKGKK